MASTSVHGEASTSIGDKLIGDTYTLTEGLLRGINVKVTRDSVLNHLDFLREVDNEYQLTEGPILNRAIDRYERYWLPLAAKNQQELLAAPLDIEWVWHCHMLSPVAYERDCLHLVQKVVPHILMKSEDREKSLHKSEDIWNKAYAGLPFYVNLKCQNEDEDIKDSTVSKICYDLVQASAKQRVFFYHVSLPHYRDVKFLENGLERYRKFLFLLKKNPDCFLAPTYDIDLLWQTHQLDPIGYKNDSMNILGKHLNHDDTVSERSEDLKLTKAIELIRKLWNVEFNESFDFPGAVYRGESTRGKLHDLTVDQVKGLVQSVSSVQLNITELQLDRLPTRVRTVTLELHYPVIHNSVNITWSNWFQSKDWTDEKNMIWKDSSLFKERINMETRRHIEFRLRGASEKGFFKKNVESNLGSGLVDCLALMHKMQGDTISFERSVTLSPSPIQLLLKGTVADPRAGCINLRMISGEFQSRETTPGDRWEVWGPVPLPQPNVHVKEATQDQAPSPNPETHLRERCYVATHKVSYINNSQVFTCKVVHSTDLMMSAVYVYHEDKLLAFGHLIGPDQLPPSSVVTKVKGKEFSDSSSLTLDPKLGERAILIKNNQGDWGVVVGRWIRVMEGDPETIVSGTKPIPACYGQLSLSFLNIANQVIKPSLSKYYKGVLKIIIGDIICYGNRIELLQNHHEAAENVALAFSIGILHVLCQPRSSNWEPGLSPNFMLQKPPRDILPPAEEVPLLMVAGALTYCPCNRNYHSDMWGTSYF